MSDEFGGGASSDSMTTPTSSEGAPVPKRDVSPHGAPCWIDLFTTDPAASRRFYGDLFGWTSDEGDPAYGGYFMFAKDGVPVAGGMRNDGSSGTPDTGRSTWPRMMRGRR